MFSRYFPAAFPDSRPSGPCEGRDRIRVCIGTVGIPAARIQNPFGAPGKSGRAVVAFDSPGPLLGSFTKEMQVRSFVCRSFREGNPTRAPMVSTGVLFEAIFFRETVRTALRTGPGHREGVPIWLHLATFEPSFVSQSLPPPADLI
jgi:hypothetical protein